MNPAQALEKFEAKHGNYVTLLCRLRSDATTPDQLEVRRLLSEHNRLVWMWVAYMAGYRKALADLRGER